MKRVTLTYTETRNTHRGNPRNTHTEVLPPPAPHSVNTHSHPAARGTRSHSSRPPGCVCPPLGASVCASGFQSSLWKGEEWLRGVRDERAGREGWGSRGRGTGRGRRRDERRRLWQRAAAAARRAWTGSPELGWAAGEEQPQELQLCQLGPSLETPAWLVHASRRWEGAGLGARVFRLGAEAEPRCCLFFLFHRPKLSMELSPRSPPEMLESDCPSALELKSAPSKKMWIKLRSL